jgi:hypothetical protein
MRAWRWRHAERVVCTIEETRTCEHRVNSQPKSVASPLTDWHLRVPCWRHCGTHARNDRGLDDRGPKTNVIQWLWQTGSAWEHQMSEMTGRAIFLPDAPKRQTARDCPRSLRRSMPVARDYSVLTARWSTRVQLQRATVPSTPSCSNAMNIACYAQRFNRREFASLISHFA